MSTETEYRLVRQQLQETEKRKQDYIQEHKEAELGLKQSAPLTFESTQISTLSSVLEDWQRRLEENMRTAAQNYVAGALKTRKTDMEAFTVQMANFEEWLSGLREAISDALAQSIAQGIEEIKAELVKRNANLPKENEVLNELIRVLKEY